MGEFMHKVLGCLAPFPKGVGTFSKSAWHLFQKCLAPLTVATLSLPSPAFADLPPAPWHLGQWSSPTPAPTPQPFGPRVFTIDPTTPALLPLRGANVGSSFALTCAPDELVVGLWGRGESAIDGIGLVCARLRPNGQLGVPEQRPLIGSGMTLPFSLRCPRHEAIIGVRGRAGTQVDRVGIQCARIRRWVEQGIRGTLSPSVGGTGGTPFADECPAGYVLQGIVGFADTRVSAIQALCVPIVS